MSDPAPLAAERPGSPFWTFSLRFYALADVPAACLALQDGAGVDVNVLLFVLFVARGGRRLALRDAQAIIAAAESWRSDIVVPLRLVRRVLKGAQGFVDASGAEALRQRVKAIELEAERLQQEALFTRFPLAALGAADSDRRAVARANVGAYERALGASDDAPFDRRAVETLLEALEKLGEP